MAPSASPTSAIETATVASADPTKPRWTPRPHEQDASIKTYDFAYLTGLPDATFSSKAYAAFKTTLLPLITQSLLIHTLLLIFGGCCSNVYSLESILKLSSSTGALITFLQFLTITLYQLPSQLTFHITSPPEPPPLQPTQGVWFPRVKRRKVPLKTWALFAAQFVAINVLNNAAFGYKISLPLHIILRSAGPVASMGVGAYWKGRRYSQRKVIAVALLFTGVVLAALSDAGSKSTGTTVSKNQEVDVNNGSIPLQPDSTATKTTFSDQIPGFILLTLALFLSAIMGIWSDALYSRYGRSQAITDEQLFYGHLLSLPFFALQIPTLHSQYAILRAASLTAFPPKPPPDFRKLPPMAVLMHRMAMAQPPTLQKRSWKWIEDIPRAVPMLATNCITQVVCISGVHRLSTQTSALTVSIVLNIRKLVSLLLSIWLFGNNLPLGVAVGAAVVFLGGGLYGIPDKKKAEGNEQKVKRGDVETKKNR
ncbi:golgi uridine diphosphate-N- acetylglucosamine transporter [Neophaeococcomyces mojaviensis]|uniref:Golgi uridine diphosphate-N- acetylglucosamine transporter n=1 Tax=Neophaeococcomyces mojaviensis TaxID=3383035 RepID=A0ACC3AEZ3_9EURO|nr:golgi uridine diphosphate-N- acetylglucosamine transporter [Knufia sp. JES_112]